MLFGLSPEPPFKRDNTSPGKRPDDGSPFRSRLSRRNSTLCALNGEASIAPQPTLPRVLPTTLSFFRFNPTQSATSEVSPTASEQQTQQDQQQEAHQSPSPRCRVGATQTRLNPQTSDQLFAHSPHSQASVLAAAGTMDQATQTQTPNPTTAATAGPAPAPIPPGPLPQQPASSAQSEANPTASRAPSTIASLPQQPAGPPIAPYRPLPYQPPYLGLGTLPTMAQPIFYGPQQYWYCYPGGTPGTNYPTGTWNQQSPWYSGTAHHLTNPPLVPQVYTVEPAYIVPQQQQATYYQTAPQAPAAAYYYYAPGAPTYYYT
ncbi:hypothetical protein F4803DRAFT_574158 [Xylaria telfairii]|nr:hypothetical protein F4803DRAFT_574158 [Xylaria telfairii]